MTAFLPWDFSLCETISRHLGSDMVEFSDLTPGYLGNVYVSSNRDKEDVAFAELCGCGVYRGALNDGAVFSFPFGGGDKAGALQVLADSCKDALLPLKFYPVGEAELAQLKGVLGGEWRVTELSGAADYIYTAQQLSAPEHIRFVKRILRKFETLGPWRARDAVAADIPAMLEILDLWMSERCVTGHADYDLCRDAVSGLWRAGTMATVVEQNGRMVSFEIGRRLNPDMLVAEFEKTDPQVPGGCQIVNREFVRRWAGTSTFVNRSCDLGNAGLAKAKQMYRPCRMVRKFVAEKIA